MWWSFFPTFLINLLSKARAEHLKYREFYLHQIDLSVSPYILCVSSQRYLDVFLMSSLRLSHSHPKTAQLLLIFASHHPEQ